LTHGLEFQGLDRRFQVFQTSFVGTHEQELQVLLLRHRVLLCYLSCE
jgi:hypothetical protein